MSLARSTIKESMGRNPAFNPSINFMDVYPIPKALGDLPHIGILTTGTFLNISRKEIDLAMLVGWYLIKL